MFPGSPAPAAPGRPSSYPFGTPTLLLFHRQQNERTAMTLEEYNKKITQIYEDLERIAEQTAQQSLTGSANTSNPLFNEIMARQNKLIKIASELNEQMLNQLNIQ